VIKILFFVHLFIGLILGIVLTTIRPDKLIIPVCMAYSIVPDILDKYLGLTYTEFGSGRTVAHSLLYIGILTLFVILLLAIVHRRTILVIAVSLSLLIHQLLDEIWKLPTTWFYPLLGKFSTDVEGLGTPGHWFWVMFWREVTSPVEWIAGICIIIVLILWYDKRWMGANVAVF
jgi:inner membrane protein